MSPYERRIPQELVRTFINEIRSSRYFIESSNTLISNFKNMGISSLKMSFVWLFETIRENRSSFNISPDFDFPAFKKLRNQVVHNPGDWDKSDVVEQIIDTTFILEKGLAPNN